MTDPDQQSGQKQGLSKEAWTGITAIAVALITGGVTIVTTLYKPSQNPTPPVAVPVDPPAQPATATASASSSAPGSASEPAPGPLPLGTWAGRATDPSGTSFPISIEINQPCTLKGRCGRISVPEVPCHGEISLAGTAGAFYEFDVSNFDSRSDPKVCKPGAGELIRPLPDGRLAYKASYSGAEGVLALVGGSR